MKSLFKKLTSAVALCLSVLLLVPSVQPAFAAEETLLIMGNPTTTSNKTWTVDLVVHYLENGKEVGVQKSTKKVKDGGTFAGWKWNAVRSYNSKKYNFVSSEFTGSLKNSKGMVADKAVVKENSAAHLYYELPSTWTVDLVVHYLENGKEVGVQKSTQKKKDGATFTGWKWNAVRTYNGKKYNFVSSEYTGSLKNSKGTVADKAVIKENSAAHLYYELPSEWTVDLVVHYLENGKEVGVQKSTQKIKDGGTFAGWTWTGNRLYNNERYTLDHFEFTGSLKDSMERMGEKIVANQAVVNENSSVHLYYEYFPMEWKYSIFYYIGDAVPDAFITGYDGIAEEVTLPKRIAGYEVIATNKDAFANCNIKKVTIPKDMFLSRNDAFSSYDSLTEVVIEEGVFICGFDDCENLTTVTISEGVTVGGKTFDSCNNLTDVIFLGNVKEIDKDAFLWTPWREKQMERLETDGYFVAGGTLIDVAWDLTEIVIPEGVTTISNRAFESRYCTATELVIPEGVKYIGYGAFAGCSSLKTVTFPKSLTEIGSAAFYVCEDLNRVVVPGNVTKIGAESFAGCSSLKELVIEEGVEEIGDAAFAGCSSLTSVVIPKGVTIGKPIGSIGTFVGGFYGDGAFENCSGLTTVVLEEGVISIGNSAFENCSSLTSVVIPEGVTDIDWDAFRDCSSLTSVVISEGVTRIGYAAFEGCNSLTEVTLPESLEYMDKSFNGTPWLEKEKVIIVNNRVFAASPNVTEVVIPKGVTSIEQSAFVNCSKLTSVVIPEGVTTIGYDAFKYCDNLKEVVIPEGVKSIGMFAFEGCRSLTSVVIPESVTEIGWAPFACGGKMFNGVLKVKVKKDSVAHKYAVDNQIPYELY